MCIRDRLPIGLSRNYQQVLATLNNNAVLEVIRNNIKWYYELQTSPSSVLNRGALLLC